MKKTDSIYKPKLQTLRPSIDARSMRKKKIVIIYNCREANDLSFKHGFSSSIWSTSTKLIFFVIMHEFISRKITTSLISFGIRFNLGQSFLDNFDQDLCINEDCKLQDWKKDLYIQQEWDHIYEKQQKTVQEDWLIYNKTVFRRRSLGRDKPLT
jgi:hypothetical protein